MLPFESDTSKRLERTGHGAFPRLATILSNMAPSVFDRFECCTAQVFASKITTKNWAKKGKFADDAILLANRSCENPKLRRATYIFMLRSWITSCLYLSRCERVPDLGINANHFQIRVRLHLSEFGFLAAGQPKDFLMLIPLFIIIQGAALGLGVYETVKTSRELEQTRAENA